MEKRGQQEIAGFVIIVVLVVVAAFIFLVISMGNKKPYSDSVEVQSILSSLVDHTTECVIGKLPLDMGDLAENAYGLNPRCDNLGKSSREYFDERIVELMERIMQVDTRFDGYFIEIYQGNVDGTLLNRFGEGCLGKETRGADVKRREITIFLGVC
jgi:hypothetical protein